MALADGREQFGCRERIPWGDPPSPWLVRYGGAPDPELRRQGRSGLAPKLPDLNPFGSEGVNYDAPALLRPSGAVLDSLLWDEATQLVENKGWKSWQIGALAEGQPWPEDTIRVDETRWHPVFRRERWYDLRVPLVPGDPSKGIMSIDNPLVWNDMSVVIELANRLFCMLIDDGFFDAMLNLPLSEVQCVSKSKPYVDALNPWDKMPRCTRRDAILGLSEQERRELPNRTRQKLLEVASSIVLTWYQDKSPQDNNLPQYPLNANERLTPPNGVTGIVTWGKFCVRLRLGASIFRSIFQCDETTQDSRTEKRLMIVFYATLLVHEITHAVWKVHCRYSDDATNNWARNAFNAEGNLVASGLKTLEAAKAAQDEIVRQRDTLCLGYQEPAVENDHASELGYAAEQAMFGGTVTMLPNSACDRSCMHTLNLSYQLYLCQFPSYAARFMIGPVQTYWDAESHWAFPRVDHIHLMPASHAANLLSQVYWETYCWGSLGMAALRCPMVFPTSGHFTDRYTGYGNFSNVFDQDVDQFMEALKMGAGFPGIRQEDDLDGRCQHAAECLSARQTLWCRLRPWYQEERRRWTRTPYGHYNLRLALMSFNHAVACNDEGEAARILMAFKWLLQDEPSYRIDDDVRAYYRVVSLAMSVAMPWRTVDRDVTVEWNPKSYIVPNLWRPSQAAREWQAQPENQQFALQTPATETCSNPAATHLERPALNARCSAMLPKWGRLAALEDALDDLEDLKERLHDNVFKTTENQLFLLQKEASANPVFHADFLQSFALFLPPYAFEEVNVVDTSSSPSSSPSLDLVDPALVDPAPVDPALVDPALGPGAGPPPPAVPPAQPGPQGVAAQPAGPFQGNFQQGGGNAFMVRVVVQDDGQDLTKKYWSAGEVGDHGGDDGKERWVLVDNDELGGYDVFSVSTLPSRLAREVQDGLQVDFKYGVRVTDHGVAARIRAVEGLFRGRLLLPRAKEEVAENDGRHGGVKWVLLGPNIYDITHFPAKDDDEHEFLWSAPYGDVLHVVLAQGPDQRHRDLDDLERRLYPFRCATLRRPQAAADSTLWRPYTMRDVNLHVFPQIRAFTCVDGWVYELTQFADMSPLGRQKLLSLAGREVGKHIRSHFPPEWTERFLRDVAPYKIGWVVPERKADNARLTRLEVQVRDCVYTFAVLVQNPKTKEDAALGRALSSLGFGGMDATEQLAEHHELKLLTERHEFVVAMLYSEPDYEVSQVDLEAHGSVSLHGVGAGEYGAEELDGEEGQNVEEYTLDGSTWARIGDVVYDVSDLVNYGDDATRARVLAFAGGAITDASLIHDIQRCGLAPAIGKFVGRKPGVKRKWSKMAKVGRRAGLRPLDEKNKALLQANFGGGCGTEHEPEQEDLEGFFVHEDDFPPIDPDDLADFSHVGIDDLREGKRIRLV